MRGLYDFIPGERELFLISKFEEKRLLCRIWKRLKKMYDLKYKTFNGGSDHGFTGGKMASLHNMCSLSPLILLRRLDLKTSFCVCFVSIRAEIEHKLRRADHSAWRRKDDKRAGDLLPGWI